MRGDWTIPASSPVSLGARTQGGGHQLHVLTLAQRLPRAHMYIVGDCPYWNPEPALPFVCCGAHLQPLRLHFLRLQDPSASRDLGARHL